MESSSENVLGRKSDRQWAQHLEQQKEFAMGKTLELEREVLWEWLRGHMMVQASAKKLVHVLGYMREPK
jgi:hypothetical protein